MRDVFITLRLGANTRARYDAETRQIFLYTDREGEFVAVVIPHGDLAHVVNQATLAWMQGEADRARREAALDNVTPFKRPEGGQ